MHIGKLLLPFLLHPFADQKGSFQTPLHPQRKPPPKALVIHTQLLLIVVLIKCLMGADVRWTGNLLTVSENPTSTPHFIGVSSSSHVLLFSKAHFYTDTLFVLVC